MTRPSKKTQIERVEKYFRGEELRIALEKVTGFRKYRGEKAKRRRG